MIFQNYCLATATQEIKKMLRNPQIVSVRNTNTHKYPQKSRNLRKFAKMVKSDGLNEVREKSFFNRFFHKRYFFPQSLDHGENRCQRFFETELEVSATVGAGQRPKRNCCYICNHFCYSWEHIGYFWDHIFYF